MNEFPRLNRRQLLRLAAGTGGALGLSALLAACGGGSTASTSAAGGGSTGTASTGGTAASSTVSAAASGTPKPGGTLRYGLSADIVNFDAHVSTGAAAADAKNMIYEALLTYDKTGKMIPGLASDWKAVDPQTYQFTLRQGVKWHTGDPLTADDVLFTFQRIADPSVGAYNAGRFKSISKIDNPDPNTIVFHLSTPNAVFPYVIADVNSAIVNRKYTSGHDLKTAPMGTGPFTFGGRQPGVQITLKKNPNYWQPGLPYLDGITFFPKPDDNARTTALLSGDVDMMDYVPYTQMGAIKSNPKLKMYGDEEIGVGWLAFDQTMKPFDDLRVRQACAYAMNRDVIAQTAFQGFGAPMNGGLIPQGWIGYDPSIQSTYAYNPDKAKALLAAAGFPNGFKTKVLSTSTYTVISGPAQAAQALLKDVGIDAQLDLQEWQIFLKTVAAGTYPAHVWGSALAYTDPDSLTNFLSGKEGTLPKDIHYDDPQIDQWLVQGRQTLDTAKRQTIYAQIDKRVLDTVPMTWLVRREQAEASQSYVNGYVHLSADSWSQIMLRQTWLSK
ncbi:MAG TPA: ABC transporter substrate-binding protein [Bacillota bacterium]|nr:ABC transporter substrate-binding protein [Bacillota bacterium]